MPRKKGLTLGQIIWGLALALIVLISGSTVLVCGVISGILP